MIYLSWALHCEGESDFAYFDIMLPNVLKSIVLRDGRQAVTLPEGTTIRLGRHDRSVGAVAQELCDAREAFHIAFIHGDMGGRELSKSVDERTRAYCNSAAEICDFPEARCVLLQPRHETEAWVLADKQAVLKALGLSREIRGLGLPDDGRAAEALTDPKAVLANAESAVRGRNKKRDSRSQLYSRIARHQDINRLRDCFSFRAFEGDMRRALEDIRAI